MSKRGVQTVQPLARGTINDHGPAACSVIREHPHTRLDGKADWCESRRELHSNERTHVGRSRLERLAPLSGLLFVAFVVGSFLLVGETPNVDDPANKVISFWQDNKDQAMFSSLLLGLAAAALVWFGASLRSTLQPAAGASDRPARLAFAGSVVLAVGLSIFAGINFTLADSVGDIPVSGTQTLNALGEDMFVTVGVGTMIFLLGLAVAILRTGGLPRWVGWVALVLGFVAISPAGFFSFLALGLIVPLLSILMFRRERAPHAGEPTRPAV
jgi:hypothetical protein